MLRALLLLLVASTAVRAFDSYVSGCLQTSLVSLPLSRRTQPALVVLSDGNGDSSLLLLGGRNDAGAMQSDVYRWNVSDSSASGWEVLNSAGGWDASTTQLRAAWIESSGELFVMTPTQVWKSVDGGSTFQLRAAGAGQRLAAIAHWPNTNKLIAICAVAVTGFRMLQYDTLTDAWSQVTIIGDIPPDAAAPFTFALVGSTWILTGSGGNGQHAAVWTANEATPNMLTLVGTLTYDLDFSSTRAAAVPPHLRSTAWQLARLNLRHDDDGHVVHELFLHSASSPLVPQLIYGAVWGGVLDGQDPTSQLMVAFNNSLHIFGNNMQVASIRVAQAPISCTSASTPPQSLGHEDDVWTSSDSVISAVSVALSFVVMGLISLCLFRWSTASRARAVLASDADSRLTAAARVIAPQIVLAAAASDAKVDGDQDGKDAVIELTALSAKPEHADEAQSAAPVIFHLNPNDSEHAPAAATASASPEAKPKSSDPESPPAVSAPPSKPLSRWRLGFRLVVLVLTVGILPITQVITDLLLVSVLWSPCVLSAVAHYGSGVGKALGQIFGSVAACIAIWQAALMYTQAAIFMKQQRARDAAARIAAGVSTAASSRSLAESVSLWTTAFLPDAESRSWSANRTSSLFFSCAHGLLLFSCILTTNARTGGYSAFMMFTYAISAIKLAWSLALDLAKVLTPRSWAVSGRGVKILRVLLCLAIFGGTIWAPVKVLHACTHDPLGEAQCSGVGGFRARVVSTTGSASVGACVPGYRVEVATTQIGFTSCVVGPPSSPGYLSLGVGADSLLLIRDKSNLFLRSPFDFEACAGGAVCRSNLTWSDAGVAGDFTVEFELSNVQVCKKL